MTDIRRRAFRLFPLLLALLPLACTAAPNVPTGDNADVVQAVKRSIVQVVVTGDGVGAFGSGVRIAPGVLTNSHVVEGARAVNLTLPDGRRVATHILAKDATRDLALLDATLASDVPSLETAPARVQRAGDTVLALGYPLPDQIGLGGEATATRGLLSRLSQQRDGVLLVQTEPRGQTDRSHNRQADSSKQRRHQLCRCD